MSSRSVKRVELFDEQQVGNHLEGNGVRGNNTVLATQLGSAEFAVRGGKEGALLFLLLLFLCFSTSSLGDNGGVAMDPSQVRQQSSGV